MSHIFVGVDIGKRNHEAVGLTDDGKISLSPIRFANTTSGLSKLLAKVQGISGSTEIVFGLEATGHYWLNLYCALTTKGFQVKVINPMQSDALRQMFIRQTKTDKKDALVIAEVLRLGRYTTTSLPSEQFLRLKTTSRFYLELMDSLLKEKQRLICVLDKVFPEYEQLFSDPLIKTSKEMMKKGILPEDLAKWNVGKLANWLKKISRGHLGKEKAQRIVDAAASSFGITIATDTLAFQLQLIVEQIEFTQKQMEVTSQKMQMLVKDMDTHITTIPGIGYTLAACILGEIGDIHRFSSAKKLVAYAGLDATVFQSGEFIGSRSHISKRGSAYLRRVLWLAANGARKFNPVCKAFWEKKLSQGKHPQVAMGAIAKKLCILIYACLSKNEPFNPDYRWSNIAGA